MSEMKQGFYVVGLFDRVFQKRRRRDDGTETVSDHVGLLIRGEEGGTQVLSVRTKNPALYSAYKRDQLVQIKVEVGAYKDYVFYQDETCRRY